MRFFGAQPGFSHCLASLLLFFLYETFSCSLELRLSLTDPRKDYKETLLRYFDADQIPQEYGGSLPWPQQYDPDMIYHQLGK